MIPEITDHSFDKIIENASTPLLVAFWSPTCRNCRALLYELERLSETAEGAITVYKMDITENHQIPAEYEISSLPTLAFFSEGRFIQFIGGLGKKDAIQSAVEKKMGTVNLKK
jgi:thioredoxin 1